MDVKDIKRYFLTSQEDLRQEDIDLTADSEIFELAQQVESELVDEYVLGNLSSSDRAAFESNYLVSEGRHAKVAEAYRLVRIAREQTERGSLPLAKPSYSPFGGRQRAYALAAAFLIAACLLAYTAVRKESPSDLTKVEVPAGTEPVEVSVPPVEVVTAETSGAKKEKPTETYKKITPATISLSQRSFRSQGREIVILVDDTRVPFLLKLETESRAQLFSNYSIKIETPEGNPIKSSTTIQKITKSAVTISVVGDFEPGTFIVYLVGFDEEEISQPIAEYAFRVIEHQ